MIVRIRYIQIMAILSGCILSFPVREISGQGRNEEITIVAPYIPSIQNAAKIPFRPEANPDAQEISEFDYQYINKVIPVTTELDPVEPMKFTEDKKQELNGNYLKAGLGNYTTPYLEFMASTRQSEKYLFGARIKHHSSQGGVKDYANSAYSHNLLSASGAAFFEPGSLSGNIGYNRDVVHYYGFPLDSFPDLQISDDDLKQRFQHFKFNVGFEGQNKAKNKLGYRINTDFHYFSDKFESRETEFNLDAGIDKQLSASSGDFRHALGVDLGLKYLTLKDTTTLYNPVIISIKPIYRFGIGQYSFEAGLSLFYITQNATSTINSGTFVYPYLRAEIVVIEGQLKVYAQVDGSNKINSFRSLAGMNPFVTSTPVILNTDKRFRISGGFTGSVSGFNFNVEASYSYDKDQPLFVNDTSSILQNKFQVIYDDVNLLNIKGSIGLLKVNSFQANLIAALYKHIPKDEEKAWHLPSFEAGLDANYAIKEKIIISAYFLVLGNRYARDFDESGIIAVKLKPAVDLNLGFEYRITSKISAFVNVNNLLNQHYQRWYQYPVQGIQGMIGGKFSF